MDAGDFSKNKFILIFHISVLLVLNSLFVRYISSLNFLKLTFILYQSINLVHKDCF